MSLPKVTESEYREHCDTLTGFCTVCEDWTREDTETDAEGYDCPDCGGNTVIGAGLALVQELIDITEDEE
jgi:hypothetical protein